MDEVGGSSVISRVASRKVLIHTCMNFANMAMKVLKKDQVFNITRAHQIVGYTAPNEICCFNYLMSYHVLNILEV